MSERRRRKAKEDESDAESQASEENEQSDSDSENGSSPHDADEPSPPAYDEAVKLEAETNAVSEKSLKKDDAKSRTPGAAPKRDPAVVPRSDRFFLHDDREGGGKSVSGRGARRGESRGSDRQDRRQPNKKEELNVWKHDKYEEIVSKSSGKAGQSTRNNERPNRPNKGTPGTQQPVQVAVVAPADDANAPDPVEAYLKKKLAPAPDYSTSRPERAAYGGRPQDSRTSRGPPTHPIESTPANNRQNKNRDPHTKVTNSNNLSNSATKQGASPAMITFSRTAPTPPGTVEKARPQTSSHTGAGSAQKQPPSQIPSYRSAVETRAPTQQAPAARSIPATAPVFVPGAAAPQYPPHQQPFVQQVHVTLQGVPAAQQTPRIEQTVRMTPITSSTGPAGPSTPTSALKPPPGLDTSLNPAAREFQPTDEASTPSSAASSHRDPRGGYYHPNAQQGYEYPPIVRPTGENGPYHEAPRGGPPAVQQVSYRPNPATPGHAQGHPQHPSMQHMQHMQSPQHGGMPRGPAPHLAVPSHGSPAVHGDYRARRDAAGRYPASPAHSEGDMYAHLAHPSMMYGAAPGAGPYNVPMNMPVYDQMVYMDPRMAQYMPDNSMWYANGPVPDAQPVSGGTVYYPLPPTPGNE